MLITTIIRQLKEVTENLFNLSNKVDAIDTDGKPLHEHSNYMTQEQTLELINENIPKDFVNIQTLEEVVNNTKNNLYRECLLIKNVKTSKKLKSIGLDTDTVGDECTVTVDGAIVKVAFKEGLIRPMNISSAIPTIILYNENIDIRINLIESTLSSVSFKLVEKVEGTVTDVLPVEYSNDIKIYIKIA